MTINSKLPEVTTEKPISDVCIVLPCAPGFSETFLQAHIEKLGAPVRYMSQFPIDIDATFNDTPTDRTEWIKQNVRVSLHRFVFNPVKERSLRQFFRANNTKAVLAEYGDTGVAILSACKELNIPLVVHFHGADAYQLAFLLRYRDAYRRMFDYSSAIIAVSKHMVDQLVELGASPHKVIYNPYGVEVQTFRPSSKETEMQAIAVGRFVEKKAPYLTILAFKRVLERLPDAKLLMVGTGMLHDMCSKMIKALHLEHAVKLMGIAGNDEIAVLMRQSRVFVQHSLTPESGDMEGTPLAVLEAGASGLPVVSTRHAGISDVVKHGETGFLVAEGDVDAMADFIYLLLSKPQLASEMGQKARVHISENFNVQQSTGKLRQILMDNRRNSH